MRLHSDDCRRARGVRERDACACELTMNTDLDRLLDIHVQLLVGREHVVHGFEVQRPRRVRGKGLRSRRVESAGFKL